MAILNKTAYLPHQLISYEETQYFLQINSLGWVLYNEHSSTPLYQFHEPLLLVQGVAASPQQIHLVMIKANGDLCYTLINGSEQAQTTILAKLDVRSNRYRRLLLFPLGKLYIFSMLMPIRLFLIYGALNTDYGMEKVGAALIWVKYNKVIF